MSESRVIPRVGVESPGFLIWTEPAIQLLWLTWVTPNGKERRYEVRQPLIVNPGDGIMYHFRADGTADIRKINFG